MCVATGFQCQSSLVSYIFFLSFAKLMRRCTATHVKIFRMTRQKMIMHKFFQVSSHTKTKVLLLFMYMLDTLPIDFQYIHFEYNSPPPQCLKITGKSLIQHCERSEHRLHFEETKLTVKQCYQTDHF